MPYTGADLARTLTAVYTVVDARSVEVTINARLPFPVHVVIDNDVLTAADVADVEDAIAAVFDEDCTDRKPGGLMVGSIDRVPVLVTPARWVLMAVPA
jgi:hypothetical protein